MEARDWWVLLSTKFGSGSVKKFGVGLPILSSLLIASQPGPEVPTRALPMEIAGVLTGFSESPWTRGCPNRGE